MKIIYVAQFSPDADGHGGNHRAYQIYSDLIAEFGEGNVVVLSFQDWIAECSRDNNTAKTRNAGAIYNCFTLDFIRELHG